MTEAITTMQLAHEATALAAKLIMSFEGRGGRRLGLGLGRR
jgi:hypothetical protein